MDIFTTRKSGEAISQEEIIAIAKKIFQDPETGKWNLNQETYNQYLITHPDEQKFLPKDMYGLISYFKTFDAYANDMICSYKYLQALFEMDKPRADRARQDYMDKKIKESRDPKIQNMLMCIRQYLDTKGDESGAGWIKVANKAMIEKLMQNNPVLTKRMLNSPKAIASYCVIDQQTNYNNMDFSSLKSILRPKIEEIRVLAPTIYATKYNII